MTKYKTFNPHQIASSKDVDDNFNLVKEGLSNCLASGSDVADFESLAQGNIDMNGKSIFNLPESNEPGNAVIASTLPNNVLIINNPQNGATQSLSTLNQKTIYFTNTNSTTQTTITTFTISGIVVDLYKPNYTYTFVANNLVSITTLFISYTLNGVVAKPISFSLNYNQTKSFTFNSFNNQFLLTNSAFNYNPPKITSAEYFYSNTNPFVLTNQNFITITTIPIINNIVNIELFISSLTLYNAIPDPNYLYYITFRDINPINNTSSSFGVINLADLTQETSTTTKHFLNSNKFPIGPALNTCSCTTFNISQGFISYNGYGVSTDTNTFDYNTYGGSITAPIDTTQPLTLTFRLIRKPKATVISNTTNYNYVLNSSNPFYANFNITYNFNVRNIST